jgi:hypothetical protein
MQNLNAEQIKKALECCSSSDGVSACESGCPYWGGDYDTCPCIEDPNFIVKNALALIKELTEENEGLHASCTELTQECKKWQSRLEIECEHTEKITVRKMRKSLYDEFLKIARCQVADEPNMRSCEVFAILDKIANELLEGSNEK